MNTPMKRLLVRADDAGGSRAANEAIVECIEAGTVHNVSFMACGLEWEHGIELLRPYAEANRVAIGLHVTLNSEWDTVKWGPVAPLTTVHSLLDGDTGYFTPAPSVLHERGFFVDEALTEVAAQLARMRNAGLPPVYLDEHMGVGWIRDLAPALKQFCQTEGLIYAHAAPVVNLDIPPALSNPGTPEALANRWLDAIKNAGERNYRLITHPGKMGLDMDDFGTSEYAPQHIARDRDQERQALCSPAFTEGGSLGLQWLRYDTL
jgi:hypothetical protein